MTDQGVNLFVGDFLGLGDFVENASAELQQVAAGQLPLGSCRQAVFWFRCT
jgi:hypothetical protein